MREVATADPNNRIIWSHNLPLLCSLPAVMLESSDSLSMQSELPASL